MLFETITLIHNRPASQVEFHRHGNMFPSMIDEGLQKLRLELGTINETLIDTFIRENNIKPSSWQTREGKHHFSMNASWKHNHHDHSLYPAFAEADTPEEAKQLLAATISNKHLSFGLWPPFTTVIPVPDLSQPIDPKTPAHRLEEFINQTDAHTLQAMQKAITSRLNSPEPANV